MEITNILVFAIAFALAFGISFAVRYFLHGRRFKLHESGTRHVLLPNHAEEGELDQNASFTSEQIEEMVKAKLSEFPDLIETSFDFRTSADGMLDIVFGERTYQAVDQIPDERVRTAIAEAVAEFNRKEM